MLSYHVVCKRIDGQIRYLAPSGTWIKTKKAASSWTDPNIAKERAKELGGFAGVGHVYKY